MRTFRSPDLSVLRHEVASRLGLPDPPGDAAFEQECRSFLADLRWPGGVECPRCSEASRLLWLASRSKWHCYSCRYQFSVTAGTLFHSSHLPVWKWFVAVHLMLTAPNGVSANELRRALGGSYKTAWFAAHRIRAAMRGHGAELLRSLVEAEQRESGGDLQRANLRVVARVRSLVGPHHQLSVKYLPAYIDERRWRSANRSNPHVFQDTIRALLDGEGMSYERLVAAA
jgi:transposase-like protein